MNQPKDHHFVQRAYLEAWCDPSAPEGHEPYVWLFEKDTGRPKAKAPKKVFFEKHLYSRPATDGSKDASLEKSFTDLEGRFIAVRKKLLAMDEDLDDEAIEALLLYAALQTLRLPVWRDRTRAQFQEVLDLAKVVRRSAQHATDEERRGMEVAAKLSRLDANRRIPIEAIREAHDHPFHTLTWPLAKQTAQFFELMTMRICFIPETHGLVTTNSPCIYIATVPVSVA